MAKTLIIEDKLDRGDRIISFAVMIQPLLVVLQTLLISVFNMDANSTTTYRVMLTAVPMIVAIFVSASRKPARFIIAYSIVFSLLLLTCVFFPQNQPYVSTQGFRFLIPVVVPSFLCLTTVRNYRIVEDTLYKISWVIAVFVLFYLLELLFGGLSIENYNMPFSYACLLPMSVLYSHRKLIDFIAVAAMLLSVLAIGARGPAFYFFFYVIIDVFQHKSKWRFVVLILIGVIVVSLPFFYSWFSSHGIISRTLSMFVEGELFDDSGRENIRNYYWHQLLENPYLGIGLFGDRLLEGVAYCHFIILEVLLDFGIIIGIVLLSAGCAYLISLYIRSSMENRNRILRYFCALVMPFMTSSSYLIDSDFAIFMGLCVVISHELASSKKQIIQKRLTSS